MQLQPARGTNLLDSAEIGGLVEELIQRLNRGEQVDAKFLAAEYPEAAASLEELLPAIRGLVDLSRSGPAELAEEALAGDDVSVERQLGDFRIVRQIGQGGMGVVYEAEQLSLGRHVALKILPLAAVLDRRALQRFKNEAQAAAALDHPHIVDVYGVGCERGVHYYAMRLIDGCTLAELIAQFRAQAARDPSQLPSSLAPPASRPGRVPKPAASTVAMAPESTAASRPAQRRLFYDAAMIRSIAELAINVAAGLDHAHEQGIVHRDIKPSNLMLDGQGKVWITDFGLAHIEANPSLTITGDLLGTLRYMSPEQTRANRASVDHRSDIYSFGATLYELLTLQPVIGGDDRAVLMQRILSADPIPPRQLNPQIPADLETILLKMLEKDVHARYATAEELTEDLRRFVEDQPIEARRPSLARRVAKWSQRHRALVTTVACMGLLGVAIVGGILGWWARNEAAQGLVVERVAADMLQAADSWSKQGAWPQALTELERAEAAYSGHGIQSPVRTRVASRLKDARMVLELDQIRLGAVTLAGGDFDFASTDAAYRAAFANFGISLDGLTTADAVRLVQQQEIGEELADALTNWSIVRKRLPTGRPERGSELLEVARQADPDSWRNRLRQAFGSPGLSAGELTELAAAVPLDELPPATLLLLIQACSAEHLSEPRVQTQVRQIQRLHPGDFWINFALARFFESTSPPQLDETVRYYAVAIGLRPDAAAVHSNLGATLQKQGKRQEAIAEYHLAIKLDPDFPLPYANLGLALREEGRHDEAVRMLRKALTLREDLAVVHRNLGLALLGQSRVDEATESIRRAIELAPGAVGQHYDLAMALQSVGKADEAIVAFQREIAIQPNSPQALNNLGALLEGRGEREAALDKYRQAIAWQPNYIRALINDAICLQRLGRFEEALAQARRGLSCAAGDANATTRMREVVSEAERLVKIEAQLPAFLSGERQPADARQAVDIARMCRYQRNFLDAARFYAAAFSQDATQEEGHRYDAACAGVVAAAQPVQDSAPLTGDERAALRGQALAWLRAEFNSRQERAEGGKPTDLVAAIRVLRTWSNDPDLKSVREESELARLPGDEGEAWRRLWSAVDQARQKIEARCAAPAAVLRS